VFSIILNIEIIQQLVKTVHVSEQVSINSTELGDRIPQQTFQLWWPSFGLTGRVDWLVEANVSDRRAIWRKRSFLQTLGVLRARIKSNFIIPFSVTYTEPIP
jgi:hypothetical protein